MATLTESICDVCGKTLYDGRKAPCYEYFRPRVKHVFFSTRSAWFWNDGRLDVCNPCWEKFKEWVND